MDVAKNLHVCVSVRIRPFSDKEVEADEEKGFEGVGNLIQQVGQTKGTRFNNGE